MSNYQLVFGELMCSGNSFNIDRKTMTKELDFADILNSSMNAVADRDFVLETKVILVSCRIPIITPLANC